VVGAKNKKDQAETHDEKRRPLALTVRRPCAQGHPVERMSGRSKHTGQPGWAHSAYVGSCGRIPQGIGPYPLDFSSLHAAVVRLSRRWGAAPGPCRPAAAKAGRSVLTG